VTPDAVSVEVPSEVRRDGSFGCVICGWFFPLLWGVCSHPEKLLRCSFPDCACQFLRGRGRRGHSDPSPADAQLYIQRHCSQVSRQLPLRPLSLSAASQPDSDNYLCRNASCTWSIDV